MYRITTKFTNRRTSATLPAARHSFRRHGQDLQRVIDDGRWAAERFFGRLIIFAHAAFLDAGFVAAAADDDDQENSVRLPSQVGRTASALPLRYAAAQLLHQPDAAAALPLADLCAKNGVPLDRTFMSLPADVMAAILERLEDGEDLMVVECTCTALRRLVAERDAVLWKPMYEDLVVGRHIAGVGTDEAPEMSWKERYTAALNRPRPFSIGSRATTVNLAWLLELESAIAQMWHNYHLPVPPQDLVVPFVSDDDRSDSPELPPETVPRRRRRWRAMPRDVCHGRALVHGGHNNQRRGGGGAVHSPSSRYRWSRR